MENLVDEILRSVELVEVVSEYVTLKKRGQNYVGLCPFHQEKTPSFTVNPDKNLYYCFGCGQGGNAFTFMMTVENLPFKEALKLLADRAGISLEEEKEGDRKKREKREELFSIYELAARFYQYVLLETPAGAEGREYIKKRGYSLEFAREMGLGMTPPGWDNLYRFLRKKQYNADLLTEGGLILKGNNSYYDRFRERLIFTIYNRRNYPIAFGGRLLQEQERQPKYLNSPETPLFSKSKNLFGLNWAWEEIKNLDQAIIVEGYTDVLTAQQEGIKNCVASLGTALTREQARVLKRFTDKVAIAYDSDTAGEAATLRGLDILRGEGLEVSIVELEGNKDPDEYLRHEGSESFRQRVQDSKPYIVFLLDLACRGKELTSSRGQIEAGRECVKVLGNIDNEIEREVYIKSAAEKTGLSVDTLEREIAKYVEGKSKNKDKKKRSWHTIYDQDPLVKLEEKVMSLMLDPDAKKIVREKIDSQSLIVPEHRRLAEKIAESDLEEGMMLQEDVDLNNLVARLQFMASVGPAEEIINRYFQMRSSFLKEKLLEELQEREKPELYWLNSKLVEYTDILEKQRGLRKEG